MPSRGVARSKGWGSQTTFGDSELHSLARFWATLSRVVRSLVICSEVCPGLVIPQSRHEEESPSYRKPPHRKPRRRNCSLTVRIRHRDRDYSYWMHTPPRDVVALGGSGTGSRRRTVLSVPVPSCPELSVRPQAGAWRRHPCRNRPEPPKSTHAGCLKRQPSGAGRFLEAFPSRAGCQLLTSADSRLSQPCELGEG